MARTEIPIVVIDPATGNAVSGASVSVVSRSTGTAATVYSAETGATTVTNPRTTDANGRLTGWVERGAYRLDISGSGLTSYSKNWDSAPAADASVDNPWLSQAAAWTAYTATLTASVTNPTLGAGGFQYGTYQKIGRTVIGRAKWQYGTGTVGSGTYYLNLPLTARALVTGEASTIGSGFCFGGGNIIPITVIQANPTTMSFNYPATHNGANTVVTQANPFAWANTYALDVAYTYESAA